KPSVAKKLEAGKESAFMTKEVGRIWTDAPVKLDWGVADVNDTDLEKVAEILKRLEFSSLVKRLPKNMQQMPEQGALYFDQPTLVEITEKPWPDTLALDGSVVLALAEDTLWLSPDV